MAVATDFTITTADIEGVHVAAQPTILRGSAAENKAVFDAYSDLIASRFNSLLAFIDADQSAVVDRDVLLLYASLGWVAD